MKPKIAITMGDPAGIGPEIAIRAISDKYVNKLCTPIIIGDAGLLGHIAKKLKRRPCPEDSIISLSQLDMERLGPGRPTIESGQAMIEYIEEAVSLALDGSIDAVVTCPISKDAAKKAGFKFPGHTEFIAHLTKTKDFRMMLGGEDLKVILVTIHEPIRRVPGLITREAVYKTISITDKSFKSFGMKSPRIAVAGLNPHAGEGGIFGTEDERIIAPAIKKARSSGINATGPIPPDTVFYRAVRKKEFDCVVSMYHDQGLGPLKLLHFEDGVNATLGLPIIRTSVDHGTAYDIAWQGRAGIGSLVAAIDFACRMARRRL